MPNVRDIIIKRIENIVDAVGEYDNQDHRPAIGATVKYMTTNTLEQGLRLVQEQSIYRITMSHESKQISESARDNELNLMMDRVIIAVQQSRLDGELGYVFDVGGNREDNKAYVDVTIERWRSYGDS